MVIVIVYSTSLNSFGATSVTVRKDWDGGVTQPSLVSTSTALGPKCSSIQIIEWFDEQQILNGLIRGT
jgi:hypothetical protein